MYLRHSRRQKKEFLPLCSPPVNKGVSVVECLCILLTLCIYLPCILRGTCTHSFLMWSFSCLTDRHEDCVVDSGSSARATQPFPFVSTTTRCLSLSRWQLCWPQHPAFIMENPKCSDEWQTWGNCMSSATDRHSSD